MPTGRISLLQSCLKELTTTAQTWTRQLLHQCAANEEPEAAGHSGMWHCPCQHFLCNRVPRNRQQLPRHERQVTQWDELVFVNWQDMKPVCVLSNYHDPANCGTVSRRQQGQRDQVDIAVPKQLADYQKFMKGVDFSGQMVQYYLINHGSWKWWRWNFFHHLMVSFPNAVIIAKFHLGDVAAKKTWPNFQIFVEDVAHQLTTTVTTYPPARDMPWVQCLTTRLSRSLKRGRSALCARKSQRLGATNWLNLRVWFDRKCIVRY